MANTPAMRAPRAPLDITPPELPRPLSLRGGVGAAAFLAPHALNLGVGAAQGDSWEDMLRSSGSVLTSQVVGRGLRSGLDRVNVAARRRGHEADSARLSAEQDALRTHEANRPPRPGEDPTPRIGEIDTRINDLTTRQTGIVDPSRAPSFSPSQLTPSARREYTDLIARRAALDAQLKALPPAWGRQDRNHRARLLGEIAGIDQRVGVIQGVQRDTNRQGRQDTVATNAAERARLGEEIKQLQTQRAELQAEVQRVRQGQADTQAHEAATAPIIQRIEQVDASLQNRMEALERGRETTRFLTGSVLPLGVAADQRINGEDAISNRVPGMNVLGNTAVEGVNAARDAAAAAKTDTPVDWVRLGKITAGIGATGVLAYLAYKLSQPSDDDEEDAPVAVPQVARQGRGRGRPRRVPA
jgi:hypothetical protein